MNFIRNLKPSVVVSYIVAIAIGVIAALVIFNALQPEPWRPLGPYPEQTVVAKDNARVKSVTQQDAKIPAVSVTEDYIVVTESKCAKEDVKTQKMLFS